MKHIFHKICFLVLLLPGLSVNTSAQINNPTWKADKLYNLFAYSEAIDEYEKVLAKHPDHAGAVRNLADCYRLTNNSAKAEKWYARAVDLPGARSIDKYYYAQSLMYNAKYAEAKKAFSEYAAMATADERASNAISGIDKMDEFFKDSAFAKVTNLSINSTEAEFSAVPHNEGIVFVSSRVTGSKDKEHSWTGKPFLGLYFAKGSESKLGIPEPFSTDLQSKYNDGPATFEADGKAMYFTRNSGSVSNKNDKVVKLQIVRSTIKEGKWVESESPFVP